MRRWKKSLAALLATGLFLVSGGCGAERQEIYVTGSAGGETFLAGNGADPGEETGASGERILREDSGAGERVDPSKNSAGTGGQATELSAVICVYVCGAVKSPGVYEMREGDRVFEAIRLAGGFTEEADQEWLNQAEPVRDGQKLQIFTKEETVLLRESVTAPEVSANQEGNGSPAGEGQQKINLNTASKEELMTLRGIGEAKAEAILAYRQVHGAFASIEEIQNIPGIKSAVFSKIKDQIKV